MFSVHVICNRNMKLELFFADVIVRNLLFSAGVINISFPTSKPLLLFKSIYKAHTHLVLGVSSVFDVCTLIPIQLVFTYLDVKLKIFFFIETSFQH